ncbi:hypothetical protein ACU4GR_22495 [Methylobacterium oryzae CBMB20]
MMRDLERAQEHMMLLGRKSARERIASFLLALSERMADLGWDGLPAHVAQRHGRPSGPGRSRASPAPSPSSSGRG